MICPNCGTDSQTQFSCSNCETLLDASSEPMELDNAPTHAPAFRPPQVRRDAGPSPDGLELDLDRSPPPARPTQSASEAVTLPEFERPSAEPFPPAPALNGLYRPRWQFPSFGGIGPKGVLGAIVALTTGVMLFFIQGLGSQQNHTAGATGLMLLGGEVRPAMVNTAESMVLLGRTAIEQVSAPDADRARLLAVQRGRFEAMNEARNLRVNGLSANDRPIMDALSIEARQIVGVLNALEGGRTDEAATALKAAEAALVRVKELDATLPPSPPGEGDPGLDQLLAPPPRR